MLPDVARPIPLQSVSHTLPRSCLSCIHGLPPVLSALIKAVEARDPYTAGHSRRVTSLALQVADVMELSAPEQHKLRVAAEVHDVGKIGISDTVLNKPGLLTPAERAEMESHATIGARIVGAVFPELADIVLMHHEHWNGRGYFQRIGDEIPLLSQIIAVCDSYDAMTSDRPYRPGMAPAEARAILLLDEANQWDEHIVAMLLAVLTMRSDVLG